MTLGSISFQGLQSTESPALRTKLSHYNWTPSVCCTDFPIVVCCGFPEAQQQSLLGPESALNYTGSLLVFWYSNLCLMVKIWQPPNNRQLLSITSLELMATFFSYFTGNSSKSCFCSCLEYVMKIHKTLYHSVWLLGRYQLYFLQEA